MHALVLLCINQQTKFEVPSFTNSRNMIKSKLKKTGHMILTIADDTQLLRSSSTATIKPTVDRLQDCVTAIHQWIGSRPLQRLN